MSVVLTPRLACSARHHLVVARELAGSRLTGAGRTRGHGSVFVNDTHELIETKHSLLELGSKDSRSCSDPTESNGQCLLGRDVGRTDMLSK